MVSENYMAMGFKILDAKMSVSTGWWDQLGRLLLKGEWQSWLAQAFRPGLEREGFKLFLVGHGKHGVVGGAHYINLSVMPRMLLVVVLRGATCAPRQGVRLWLAGWRWLATNNDGVVW